MQREGEQAGEGDRHGDLGEPAWRAPLEVRLDDQRGGGSGDGAVEQRRDRREEAQAHERIAADVHHVREPRDQQHECVQRRHAPDRRQRAGNGQKQHEPRRVLLRERLQVLHAALVLVEAGANLCVVGVREEPVVRGVSPREVRDVDDRKAAEPQREPSGLAEDGGADVRAATHRVDARACLEELECDGDGEEQHAFGTRAGGERPHRARRGRPAVLQLADVQEHGDDDEQREHAVLEPGARPCGERPGSREDQRRTDTGKLPRFAAE